MPVPTAVGIAVAVAANTDSGRKAIQSLEELPLLAARSASDAAMRHGAQLPIAAQTWYNKLTPAQLTGAMLIAAAAVTFSLLSTLIKLASASVPAIEIVFWRAAVAWVLNSVRSARRSPGVRPCAHSHVANCVLSSCASGRNGYRRRESARSATPHCTTRSARAPRLCHHGARLLRHPAYGARRRDGAALHESAPDVLPGARTYCQTPLFNRATHSDSRCLVGLACRERCCSTSRSTP